MSITMTVKTEWVQKGEDSREVRRQLCNIATGTAALCSQVASGGVIVLSLSVTEAGNVISLLNKRFKSARQGLNDVQIAALSQNCQDLKEMLSSCEICSIFAPTTAVLGELPYTNGAWPTSLPPEGPESTNKRIVSDDFSKTKSSL